MDTRTKKKLFDSLYTTYRYAFNPTLEGQIFKLSELLHHYKLDSLKLKERSQYNVNRWDISRQLKILRDDLITQDGYTEIWKQVSIYKKFNISTYNNPKRKNKKVDNKYVKVGGGYGGNRNKVRFPSRKHKNRWKRFIKLFPRYESMYKEYFP